MNAQKQYHCDGGAAIEYLDGWGVYLLNGVRMDKKHVMTPAETFSVEEIFKTKNVEQRRELIRRFGVERLPHTTLETKGMYELWEVDLSKELDNVPEEFKHCKYLKMKNPSLGTWHVEGVGNECQTIQDALNFRRYGKINRELPNGKINRELLDW